MQERGAMRERVPYESLCVAIGDEVVRTPVVREVGAMGGASSSRAKG